MPYIPVYAPDYDPARRWAAVDAMMLELLTARGLQAQYRPVYAPWFDSARRWADVQAMLDAMSPANPVQVYPWAYDAGRRWVALDGVLQEISNNAPIGYAPVLILIGDSQGAGTQDDASTAGYVANDKVKIWNGSAYVNYNPGVSGASGLQAGNATTRHGPELEFARQWMATYPTETLYIFKDCVPGSFQGIGIAKTTATINASGNTISVTGGSLTLQDVLKGITSNDGKTVYYSVPGFLSRVGATANPNVAAVTGATVTPYSGAASWSSDDGLLWNGNSGSITNGARARAIAALAALTNPKIIAFGLVLGTNDKGTGTTANQYEAATTAFLTRIRSDITLTTTPVVQPSVTTTSSGPTVRASQATIAAADSRFKVVDMDAQPLSADAVHWKQAGLNYFGAQMFGQRVM